MVSGMRPRRGRRVGAAAWTYSSPRQGPAFWRSLGSRPFSSVLLCVLLAGGGFLRGAMSRKKEASMQESGNLAIVGGSLGWWWWSAVSGGGVGLVVSCRRRPGRQGKAARCCPKVGCPEKFRTLDPLELPPGPGWSGAAARINAASAAQGNNTRTNTPRSPGATISPPSTITIWFLNDSSCGDYEVSFCGIQHAKKKSRSTKRQPGEMLREQTQQPAQMPLLYTYTH